MLALPQTLATRDIHQCEQRPLIRQNIDHLCPKWRLRTSAENLTTTLLDCWKTKFAVKINHTGKLGVPIKMAVNLC